MAHSSSYQEFKAGGYIAYFSLEGERSAAGKAGSDSDASECWARCAWVLAWCSGPAVCTQWAGLCTTAACCPREGAATRLFCFPGPALTSSHLT